MCNVRCCLLALGEKEEDIEISSMNCLMNNSLNGCNNYLLSNIDHMNNDCLYYIEHIDIHYNFFLFFEIILEEDLQ